MRKSKEEKFYLYKYFSLEGKFKTPTGHITRLSGIMDLLLNKRIFIPSLKVLNDPFEEMVNEDKELKSTEAELNKGILSFTTHYDNLLMWSHYGNSHTGVVVKFSIQKEEENNFKKVQYVQATSELNLHERILVKSYHWNYENEYRRSFTKSSQHTSLSSIGLKIEGVITGSKCLPKNFEQIYEICLAEKIKLGSVELKKDFSCSLKNGLSELLKQRRSAIMQSIEFSAFESYHDDVHDYAVDEAQSRAQAEYYEDLENKAESTSEYKKLLRKQKSAVKKLAKFKI